MSMHKLFDFHKNLQLKTYFTQTFNHLIPKPEIVPKKKLSLYKLLITLLKLIAVFLSRRKNFLYNKL